MRNVGYWCASLLVSGLCTHGGAQVTTSQYDNMRTGAIVTETTLTPANVNTAHFGKIGAFQVDGPVYAQPLFVSAVAIPGKGRRDVLFVATEHDSVYAFDAEHLNTAPLWYVSFLDEKNGVTAVQDRDILCQLISPEVGVTATPVIDMGSGTLFVLARTMKGGKFFQHLHALALGSGAERAGGPKLISGSVAGNASDALNGRVAFDAQRENSRASLLLVNHQVVLTWASSCDVDPYHGWVMSYDAKTLRQTGVFNTTPNGQEGGIWASDTGPGADVAGNIYIATGNGTFDEGGDYGDSVLKLGLTNGVLAVRDFFTPHDQALLEKRDADLGSSGPLLLPDQPGAHPHLLPQPNKGSVIFVLDRDNMGKFEQDKDAVVQTLKQQAGGYGAMAYWNGHVFFASNNDFLREYRVTGGGLEEGVVSEIKFPSATPSISSNHDANAIVWAIATRLNGGQERPAVLYAFDANDISRPIYTSEENGQRDRAALATRFVIPVVVKGHVYFGTRDEVEMYGLLQ